MKLIASILLSLIFILPSYSQTKEEQVKEVINTYFKGYSAGDTIVLKEAFHPSFHLSYISPWHQGEEAFKQVDRDGMFAFFGPNWSNLEIESVINEFAVSRHAATAKATVTLKGIVIWTDYLSLLKIDDRWWIVSKISEGKRIKKLD